MRLLIASLLWTSLALPVAAGGATARAPLTVYAAVSLTDALGEIGRAYEAAHGVPVRFSFAATSVLARQIEAGARADVFVSADQEWMDHLAARRLVERQGRVDVVANRLVLVAPADSRVQLRVTPGFPLLATLGNGRLSTADPDTVPAGRYARAALVRLGVWSAVAPRLVRADNVRSALAFVARGETPLGIVYETDARAERRVRVVDTFPADSHPPITYPAAVVADAGAEARRFVTFLGSPSARRVFAEHGFRPPPSTTTADPSSRPGK